MRVIDLSCLWLTSCVRWEAQNSQGKQTQVKINLVVLGSTSAGHSKQKIRKTVDAKFSPHYHYYCCGGGNYISYPLDKL